MRCMKCGVQIPDQDAFCQSCLGEMEKYPVRANVTIQLPPRNDAPTARKKARRREGKPEEVLRRQRKAIRRLRFFLVLSLVLLLLTAGLLLRELFHRDRQPAIGQNYNTVTESSTP